MSKVPQTPSLTDLRKEIDRIDEAMHNLLMERGEIIDRLIATKKTQEVGSAFRPAREAEMMRRLVKRHKGILPLDTAEGIWRVIISTFTYVQAPFSLHADLSAGDALMRDSARFHFGFTVPFVPHMGASGVVAAVSASKGDLGLVPAVAVAGAGAWWSALEFDSAPKIIARLPFVERADLSAGDALMRDSARFHFGFTVPFVPHMGASGVVAAVSASKGDLGLVPAVAVAGAGAWWSALEFDSAPKIIARLPFVERADHPAALPVFVISRVAADAMVTETSVWSVRVSGWSGKAAQSLSTLAEFVAVPDSAFDGAALLVTLPQGVTLHKVTDALVKAGASMRSTALVGSHATRYTVGAEK